MLDLYIIRHADAEYESLSRRDFDRSLSEKGFLHAQKTGKQLGKIVSKSIKIISSPAKRAFQTAQFIAQELTYPDSDILLLDDIYNASLKTLLKLINAFENQDSAIILVGHSPGLSDVCEYISGKPQPLATAEVANYRFDIDDWRSVCKASGILKTSIDPRIN